MRCVRTFYLDCVREKFFILFSPYLMYIYRSYTPIPNFINVSQNIIISVRPNGRYFIANSDTKSAILPKGRSSIANSGT